MSSADLSPHPGVRPPVIRPLDRAFISALSSSRAKKSSRPWITKVFPIFMKALINPPVNPMTVVEPARHSRLGDKGSSAIGDLSNQRLNLTPSATHLVGIWGDNLLIEPRQATILAMMRALPY